MKFSIYLSLAFSLSASILFVSSASAIDFEWNVAGPADWSVGTNWNPEGPPSGGGGNHAHIRNGGTADITSDVSDFQDIFIARGADTSGTVNHSAGSLTRETVGWVFVGQQGGNGTYNLSGTALDDKRQLVIGENANSVGVVNVTGDAVVDLIDELWVGNAGGSGTINADSGVIESDTWIAIGRDSATGVVNLSGDAILRKVIVDDENPENTTNSEKSFITLGGLGSGSGGTLNVSGNATVESDGSMILAESAGRYGIVNQSGGSVILHDNPKNVDGLSESLKVDHAGSGLGEYHLSGGLLHAETVLVGAGLFDMTGGVLSATNFIGDLSQGGGSVSPGSSPGTMLVTGNYSLVSGDLYMEIEGTGAGTGYDQLIVTGDVSLAGDLTLAGSYVPSLGDSFTLIDNQGANAISGIFTGLAEGSIVSFNGVDLTATYLGGDGNDFVLFSIPEPSSLLLAGIALLGMTVRKRR